MSQPKGKKVVVVMDMGERMPGKVIDLLSSQFTVKVPTYGTLFCFYADERISWFNEGEDK